MKNFGISDALAALGVKKSNQGVSTGTNWLRSSGSRIESYSPVDGKLIGAVQGADEASYRKAVKTSMDAFREWRNWPAPSIRKVVYSSRAFMPTAVRAPTEWIGNSALFHPVLL